jgi:hypothetical protein
MSLTIYIERVTVFRVKNGTISLIVFSFCISQGVYAGKSINLDNPTVFELEQKISTAADVIIIKKNQSSAALNQRIAQLTLMPLQDVINSNIIKINSSDISNDYISVASSNYFKPFTKKVTLNKELCKKAIVTEVVDGTVIRRKITESEIQNIKCPSYQAEFEIMTSHSGYGDNRRQISVTYQGIAKSPHPEGMKIQDHYYSQSASDFIESIEFNTSLNPSIGYEWSKVSTTPSQSYDECSTSGSLSNQFSNSWNIGGGVSGGANIAHTPSGTIGINLDGGYSETRTQSKSYAINCQSKLFKYYNDIETKYSPSNEIIFKQIYQLSSIGSSQSEDNQYKTRAWDLSLNSKEQLKTIAMTLANDKVNVKQGGSKKWKFYGSWGQPLGPTPNKILSNVARNGADFLASIVLNSPYDENANRSDTLNSHIRLNMHPGFIVGWSGWFNMWHLFPYVKPT